MSHGNQQLAKMPERIFRKVIRKMNSGEFYTYAFVRAITGPYEGKQVVQDFDHLTVGELGELIARHRERARKAAVRYHLTGSESSARTAADHIFRCNRYAVRREELLGNELDSREWPFPFLTEEEVATGGD